MPESDGKCLNMAAKFYAELELPEGSFEMRVCAASAWWQDLTVTVNLNGETVYSEKAEAASETERRN